LPGLFAGLAHQCEKGRNAVQFLRRGAAFLQIACNRPLSISIKKDVVFRGSLSC
jgi:hypothetical protein